MQNTGESAKIGDSDKPDGLDRALGDRDRDGDDSMRMEVAPSKRQVFIKTVPPSTGRRELETVGPHDSPTLSFNHVIIAITTRFALGASEE
jgi:hypothetical protein